MKLIAKSLGKLQEPTDNVTRISFNTVSGKIYAAWPIDDEISVKTTPGDDSDYLDFDIPFEFYLTEANRGLYVRDNILARGWPPSLQSLFDYTIGEEKEIHAVIPSDSNLESKYAEVRLYKVEDFDETGTLVKTIMEDLNDNTFDIKFQDLIVEPGLYKLRIFNYDLGKLTIDITAREKTKEEETEATLGMGQKLMSDADNAQKVMELFNKAGLNMQEIGGLTPTQAAKFADWINQVNSFYNDTTNYNPEDELDLINKLKNIMN